MPKAIYVQDISDAFIEPNFEYIKRGVMANLELQFDKKDNEYLYKCILNTLSKNEIFNTAAKQEKILLMIKEAFLQGYSNALQIFNENLNNTFKDLVKEHAF